MAALRTLRKVAAQHNGGTNAQSLYAKMGKPAERGRMRGGITFRESLQGPAALEVERHEAAQLSEPFGLHDK